MPWVSFTVQNNTPLNDAVARPFSFKVAGVALSAAAKTHNVSFDESPLQLDLTETSSRSLVPNSIAFNVFGSKYLDRNGVLYRITNDTSFNSSGAAAVAGAVDYDSGVVSLTAWTAAGSATVSMETCLSVYGDYTSDLFFFRTAGAPLRPASLFIQVTADDGTAITATADQSGIISGPLVSGSVDQSTGIVRVQFGEWVTAAGNEGEDWYRADEVVGGQAWRPKQVFPSTLLYSAVTLTNLPLNASILGLDPVRLPADGRVPIYRPADVIVIHNTKAYTLPNPVQPDTEYNVGRIGLSELWVVDANGAAVDMANFGFDLDTGIVTTAPVLNLGTAVQPLKVKHRIEHMALLTDAQINGQLEFSPATTRSFDADSYVSSAVLFGDMNARVTNLHDLAAFTTWADTPTGAGATAQYNSIDYPIVVENAGAVNERWRLNFTSSTNFQVIGENLGVVGTGVTTADTTITNPLTGFKFFTIKSAGFGVTGSWASGNNIRFNTLACANPLWLVRSILAGASLGGDSFGVQNRGDVDLV